MNTATRPGFLDRSGEMAGLISKFAWTASSIGSPEFWPQSLKMAVKLLLSSHHPMILYWGEDLLQIYNDAYIELISGKHSEVLGHPIAKTGTEDIQSTIQEVMATRIPKWLPEQHFRVNRFNHTEEACFNLSYSPIEGDNDIIKGVLCICSEVTPQVPTERDSLDTYRSRYQEACIALQESEAKLRKVFESDIVGIVFWTKEDGQIIDANDAFLRMIDFSREEMLQGKVNWRELTPKELSYLDEKAFGQLAATGKSEPFEKQYVLRDGRRVDILLAVSYFQGQTDGGVAFVLDITKQKQADRALRESEERFRTMADAAPVMIWVSDENGDVTFWNDTWRQFTGLSIEEQVSIDWKDFIHADDFHTCMDTYSNAIKEQAPFTTETRIKRHDGEYRWIKTTGTPRFSTNNLFTGFVGICVDITDLKLAKESAEETSRRKSQFLANMSHELRTPLHVIIGYSEMLIRAMAGPLSNKQQQYTENVLTSGKHLLDIVNNVLDISKLEAGKLELEREVVDLVSLIQELRSAFELMARKHNISLSFHYLENPIFVNIDKARIKQVFFNLIANAIKFNKPGGKVNISLSVSVDKGWVIIKIEDTGIGIPHNKLDHLFTEFFQVDPTTSRQYGGTGLGLALVKQFVGLHGGSIDVDSTENMGSTFMFKLPYYDIFDFTKPSTVQNTALTTV